MSQFVYMFFKNNYVELAKYNRILMLLKCVGKKKYLSIVTILKKRCTFMGSMGVADYKVHVYMDG